MLMSASQVKITLKKIGRDLRETEETPGKEKKKRYEYRRKTNKEKKIKVDLSTDNKFLFPNN